MAVVGKKDMGAAANQKAKARNRVTTAEDQQYLRQPPAQTKYQNSNSKQSTKDPQDDESNFKNRTLRFTNNNFLCGVTSASGFASGQASNLKVTYEGGWAGESHHHGSLGRHQLSGNIND